MSKENILFTIFYLTYDTCKDILQLWQKFNYQDFSVRDANINGTHEAQRITHGFAQSVKVPTGIDPGATRIKRARGGVNDEP
jgi:hypothetical protein